MDRGFTVEGLTVTYMPRSVGVGNADTIQQRARFFGYKSGYLGYCRIYLDQDARDTYVEYVRHEEDMRRRLRIHRTSGRTLNDWYREVFLPSNVNLSRRSVFSSDFERAVIGGEWQTTKAPHTNRLCIDGNERILREFIREHSNAFSSNPPVLEISLQIAYDELLNQLRYTSEPDQADFNSLLYVLEYFIEEDPDASCTIFLMSDFDDPRERSLTDENKINQLFQGRNLTYQGDRALKGSGITFQIHVLNLLREATIVERNVVALAAFIPKDLAKEIIRSV